MEQQNQLNQQNIPQPPQQNIQPEMPKQPGLPKWIVVLGIITIFAAVCAAGYTVYLYFIVEPDEPEPEPEPIVYSEDCSWRPNQDLETCQEDQKFAGAYFNGTECLNITSCSTPFENQQSCQTKCIKEIPAADIQKYNLEVVWEDSLEPLDIDCQLEHDSCDYYYAGVIKNGILAGRDIYLEVMHSMGDVFRHYIMLDNNQFYFDGYYGDEAVNNWEIKGITDLPEEIYFSDTNYKLSKYPYTGRLFSNIKDAEKVFYNSEMGDFYLTNRCLLTELPDHRAVSYDFILPFISSEDKVLKVTFNNGQENQDEYMFKAFVGCGAICHPLDIVEDEVNQQDLIKAGEAASGEIFYGLKDPQHKMLTDLYNNKSTKAYYNTDGTYRQLEQSKYTYEEYLALQPLLFWQDPLGRWIKLKNAKFDTLAEVCKPAIYLYPEETINLNVRVEPNGGFTETIPDYPVDGWNIEVSPDGTIIDLSANKKYDYLYWSGIGFNYPIKSDVGWVVAKEDIEMFLDNKLQILGLNNNEISDFKEYWLDRLNKTPYYHIWFMPHDQIDRIAPLFFSPSSPDSVIRVIMNVKELDGYKQIDEQQLPDTPQRNGFTVVEWGGTLIR